MSVIYQKKSLIFVLTIQIFEANIMFNIYLHKKFTIRYSEITKNQSFQIEYQEHVYKNFRVKLIFIAHYGVMVKSCYCIL